MAGTTYNDGDNNRTRSDTAQGTIINDYVRNQQMSVVPNPNGKGYVCEAACPTQGGYENALQLKPTAQDAGKALINGVETEEWKQYVTLLKIIRMEEQDFYVDQSDPSAPKPVCVIEKITPFDIPIIHPVKELGETATNYTNFTHAKLDPELFDIANCSATHCDCPPPQNGCGDDSVDFSEAVRRYKGMQVPLTMLQEIKRSVSPRSTPPVIREVRETAGGTWPTDWSATESALMLINQGGSREADGDICCHPEATVIFNSTTLIYYLHRSYNARRTQAS